MLRPLIAAACAALLFAAPLARAADAIAAAVADPARPETDRARDADRKPAETLAFAGVKPGDKVGELLPGGGYFTRLLSKTVGAKGHVYAAVAAEVLSLRPGADAAIKAIAADKAYANITVSVAPIADFSAPKKLDLVWTSLNYHDLKLKALPIDTAKLNKAVFDALKPGGIFLVLDHAAAPGSGLRDVDSLHRIDPEAVKAEITAAGFVLDSESPLLRNPQDDHTQAAMHGPMRGHTDQFLLKFRKPKT